MIVKPLRIGNITIDFPVMLAPMAGYTDLVMRMLARRYCCGMAFTEVAGAEGITRGIKQTFHILETAPQEQPVAAHIYGSKPDTLAWAAAIIERTGRFQAIDLNCGCPVARITAKGAGAALMKHTDKIAQIIRAMKRVTSLPITVKTRLAISSGHMNEIIRAVEESGGSMLTIHARQTAGRHTGRTDWPALARIKSECSIPVIGNGGVSSAEDVSRMFAETGVDGVLIGKAAIGNPWIFQEAWSVLHGRRIQPHPMTEHRAVIEEHLGRLIVHEEKAVKLRRNPRLSAEEKAVLHFRGHLLGYIRGFKKSAEVKRKLQDLRRATDIMAAVDGLLDLEAQA